MLTCLHPNKVREREWLGRREDSVASLREFTCRETVRWMGTCGAGFEGCLHGLLG